MVNICVLGPLKVEVEGQAANLGSRLARATLAQLLIARGAYLPVDRLVQQLWQDTPPPSAHASLQVHIAKLRRVLEPDRPPRAPARLLVSAPYGYALHLPAEHHTVDARHFEEEVAACLAVPPQHGSGVPDRLTAVLDLWAGPAYAEFADEPWAADETVRLAELRQAAREALVAARLRTAAPQEALADADALTREHPLREEGWRLLALAHWASGRQGDALAALRRARVTLRDELGVDPGPALAELETAVLQQRLEILHRSTRPAAGTPPHMITAPQSAPQPGPRVSPPAAGDLLGRDTELTGLVSAAAAVRRGRGQVVLLSGEAGIGKSSLLDHLEQQLPGQGCLVARGHCPETDGATARLGLDRHRRHARGRRPSRRRPRPIAVGGRPRHLGRHRRRPGPPFPPAPGVALLARAHRGRPPAGPPPGRPAPGGRGKPRTVPALRRAAAHRPGAAGRRLPPRRGRSDQGTGPPGALLTRSPRAERTARTTGPAPGPAVLPGRGERAGRRRSRGAHRRQSLLPPRERPAARRRRGTGGSRPGSARHPRHLAAPFRPLRAGRSQGAAADGGGRTADDGGSAGQRGRHGRGTRDRCPGSRRRGPTGRRTRPRPGRVQPRAGPRRPGSRSLRTASRPHALPAGPLPAEARLPRRGGGRPSLPPVLPGTGRRRPAGGGVRPQSRRTGRPALRTARGRNPAERGPGMPGATPDGLRRAGRPGTGGGAARPARAHPGPARRDTRCPAGTRPGGGTGPRPRPRRPADRRLQLMDRAHPLVHARLCDHRHGGRLGPDPAAGSSRPGATAPLPAAGQTRLRPRPRGRPCPGAGACGRGARPHPGRTASARPLDRLPPEDRRLPARSGRGADTEPRTRRTRRSPRHAGVRLDHRVHGRPSGRVPQRPARRQPASGPGRRTGPHP
ncbi:BTAD domain-containing putative transcriptional regulator [Streptomyces sp. NPDC059467]|uniref:BTAD domain-containing putative transcriptional regulator n=1 Tax=Streptomyces sp. NPDC059467 TaxID=3346844 RepID=UPI00368AF9B3